MTDIERILLERADEQTRGFPKEGELKRRQPPRKKKAETIAQERGQLTPCQASAHTPA
jgi:hypothetical protein